MPLADRDYDEIDQILIPAAESLSAFTAYMRDLGASPKQMLAVLRERLPIAKSILNESDTTLH